MNRPAALVALLALSWSQLVALHCDMGSGVRGGVAVSAPASHAGAVGRAATTDAHHHGGEEAPAAQHGAAEHGSAQHGSAQHGSAQHGQPHGGDHSCLMIMACGYASVRNAPSASMTRFPAISFRSAFLANPTPVTADRAVETPPPRLNA